MELNNPVLYRIDGRKDWITIAPFIQSYSRSPGGLSSTPGFRVLRIRNRTLSNLAQGGPSLLKPVGDFDIDFERRNVLAPIQPDSDLVRIELYVL